VAGKGSDPKSRRVELDGSRGEGGGQILRTALSLSLVTGLPFRLDRIRAGRDKPGLRPQHLRAVEAAAELGNASVTGAEVGSRQLTFTPGEFEARDLNIDIGSAGSTSLVLQTIQLPIALRAKSPVRVVLTGGTFNPKAPPFPFLRETWRAFLLSIGMPIGLASPIAGFYPRGGGRLEAWIEPSRPGPLVLTERGPLRQISGIAGVANLPDDIAKRMKDRVLSRLEQAQFEALTPDFSIEVDVARWKSPGSGAAVSLTVEHEASPLGAATIPATFTGLGEQGKPAEAVADEAVEALLAYEAVSQAAIEPHSADQILLPLAMADGASLYTVSEVTEHLRTNAGTIRAFLDRSITIEEPLGDDRPGRVVIA
jgi:RNA 3'-terminal phosphate cyclase (ATP)